MRFAVIYVNGQWDGPVIQVFVGVDLAAIVPESLDHLREILVHGVELNAVFLAPPNGVVKVFSTSVCPQDEPGSLFLLFQNVADDRLLGRSDGGPTGFAERPVEIDGDDLVCHQVITTHRTR
jgi:hypothetical protein